MGHTEAKFTGDISECAAPHAVYQASLEDVFKPRGYFAKWSGEIVFLKGAQVRLRLGLTNHKTLVEDRHTRYCKALVILFSPVSEDTVHA